MVRITVVLTVTLILMAGCRQPLSNQQSAYNSPFGQTTGADQFAGQPSAAQMGQLAKQVEELSSRLVHFNSDNDNLHTQVATLQQRLQNANNYNDQLKQQLSDTVVQLQKLQAENQQYAGQIQTQNAQSQGRGGATRFAGATIRANNSLMANLNDVQLPGLAAWMDGDVIRIEAPTDRIFVSGTYQINNNDAQTFGNLANIIRRQFPRQVVGVEAHWDGTPIQPATTSHHQLTATQALAVFDLLIKSGLPHDQVFTMAMGSNRPRYNIPPQNGISRNRRIEIVIYPETFN